MSEFLSILNLTTIVILYVQMALCFVLNIISVTFIVVVSKSYNPISLLIINLAISDILYSSCVPYYVRQFSGGVISQTGCRVAFILDVTCMIVNI
jgi:hypothetical protein